MFSGLNSSLLSNGFHPCSSREPGTALLVPKTSGGTWQQERRHGEPSLGLAAQTLSC